MELVEVALKVELILRPDTFQAGYELSASTVSLSVIEPPLAYRREFLLEPSGHHVDGNSSLGIIVNASNLFCRNGWIPWPWKQGRHYCETVCEVEYRLRKRDRFVLIIL